MTLIKLQCSNNSDCTGMDSLCSLKMLPVCNVINYSINFLRTVTNFLLTHVALLEHEDGALLPKHDVQFMNAVNNRTLCHCMQYSSTRSKTPQTCLWFIIKKHSALWLPIYIPLDQITSLECLHVHTKLNDIFHNTYMCSAVHQYYLYTCETEQFNKGFPTLVSEPFWFTLLTF